MKPKQNYKPGPMDSCQTPAYGVKPLLPYIIKFAHIWEPARGEGYLAKALKNAGHWVNSTDIQLGQDFFDYIPEQYNKWDAIVTNPPYSLKFRWIARCYELGKPFALLMPVETLGAKSAQMHFKADPHFSVILLNRRINFKMPLKGWDSSAQFPVAWFCSRIPTPSPIVWEHITYEDTLNYDPFI